MEIRPYLVQALSPLHAGTGQTAGVIDLPIARMRATGIPFVPGSTIKGVLRALTDPGGESAEGDVHSAVFGPKRAQQGPQGDTVLDHAGALIAADARLLALPVRSFRGTFALVTSPLLIELARRDLAESPALSEQLPPSIPRLNGRRALVAKNCINVADRFIYLEDLDLPVTDDQQSQATAWARFIANAVPAAERSLIAERFVVVDDETMAFLWDTATQIDTRIRIENGVVAEGALWTEESLPPETLLLGLLAARPSMRKNCAKSAKQLIDWTVERSRAIVQLGGKATIGRGRCRLLTWTSQPSPGKEARRANA
ncbi:MAG: type III-B CRISPR module RAMP protein Cmr4 [Proteobacteria bacterium]|nr:type III-B CRISPR module RAMP protein Cmr4 [Pseudomonadota bacterium]